MVREKEYRLVTKINDTTKDVKSELQAERNAPVMLEECVRQLETKPMAIMFEEKEVDTPSTNPLP